ncbi:hypothetical protein B0H11DRAFT_690217 [Mycena galericulata]|nr:hypothetical protein B0H11DRAFT_690217 [Mycena galericulata]
MSRAVKPTLSDFICKLAPHWRHSVSFHSKPVFRQGYYIGITSFDQEFLSILQIIQARPSAPHLHPTMLPSISKLYSLGRIISVTQFLSAALMRPLFPDIYPPEMTLFERRKLPLPETGPVLSMVTLFSGVTCLLWLTLTMSGSAKARVLWHVILLGVAAFYWTFIAVLVYLFTTRGSPFWLLVSSCANAGFTSSVKCAAIGVQLFLPLATIAVFLGSALLVYIRARERYGTGKVQLPQVVRSPAWLQANVAELGISESTQGEGVAPVHVMRFSPRTLYLLGLALSVFQGVSAFLLLSLFPRTHKVQDPSSTSFDDEGKPRRSDPRQFFALVVWLSGLICIHWCLMLARLRPKCYNDIGNVMGHVPSLAFGAMIWTAHGESSPHYARTG